MKISKSEAGRLGGLAARDKTQQRSRLQQKNYNKNPKLCLNCSTIITYQNRHNKFCDHRCSATYNNLRKFKKHATECKFCSKPIYKKKFCDKHCQQEWYKSYFFSQLENGLFETPDGATNKTLRKYLILYRGKKCQQCGNTSWLNHDIPLNVHHENGDATDNSLNNIKLLCLNCHGITETFGRKNKKSTRVYRYKAEAEN